MKNFTSKGLLLILAVGMAIQFASCEKEEMDYRRNFRGTYNVEEYSFKGNKISTFESRISLDNFSDDHIWISNFFGVGIDVKAMVMGSKLFIPDQTIGYFEIKEGQGSISSNNVISLDYTVIVSFPNSESYTDFLEATYVRRH